MDFVITTFCNLNCKNCCALMPYYRKPFHYPLEEIKKNLKKLSDCEMVRNIQIIGGETLLHPDINEIIKYVSTLDFDIISIYTNCTTIPEGFEEVLKHMDSRFYMCLTEYGEKSKCFNKLVQLCEMYNIQYEINGFGNIVGASKGKEWLKTGNPDIKPFPKISYDTCGQVMTCMGDKIFRCTRIAHLSNIVDLQLDEDEYFDINELTNEKYEQFKEVKFTKNCNRCLRGTSLCTNIPKGS